MFVRSHTDFRENKLPIKEFIFIKRSWKIFEKIVSCDVITFYKIPMEFEEVKNLTIYFSGTLREHFSRKCLFKLYDKNRKISALWFRAN